jgi:hypothetical protein
MRGGNAHSARGAAGFIRETIARVRAAGARGPLTVRADSAFYSKGFLWACREADARFSVTVKMNPSIRRAIDGIPDDAWTKIPYWLEGGADVAELPYRCFAGRHAMKVRLIVRRVRPTPGSQLALDVVFDYHALVTDREGTMFELEADHRDHAVVELVIRDLKADAGLAHLPSGKFPANAAWLALTTLAYNLGRWTLRAPAASGPPPPSAPCAAACCPCRPGWRARPAGCACARPRIGPGGTPSCAPVRSSPPSPPPADRHPPARLSAQTPSHRPGSPPASAARPQPREIDLSAPCRRLSASTQVIEFIK